MNEVLSTVEEHRLTPEQYAVEAGKRIILLTELAACGLGGSSEANAIKRELEVKLY